MANFVINLEDTVGVSDTSDSITKLQPRESFVDSVAIGEEFSVLLKQNQLLNFVDDIVNISDDMNFHKTQRYELNFVDTVLVSDTLEQGANDRFELSFNDIVGVSDISTQKGTDRITKQFEEAINVTDVLGIQYGIAVENGTVDGEVFKSFNAGTIAEIEAIPPFNFIFIQWEWLGLTKLGIENVYSRITNLTVPNGGGTLVPVFFNVGTITPNTESLVIVLSINDFEYVEDIAGDFIRTLQTIAAAGSSMGVAKHNFVIEQGSTFQNIVIYRDVDGNPVDLTGYTAAMDIRQTKESSIVIQELNTSNGYLQLDGVNGTVTIDLPANITDALDFVWGVYDLELYPAGDVNNAVRLLEGKVSLSKQVTRP